MVKVIRAKIPDDESKTLDAALLYITWKAKERFLRAVEWNFSARTVEDLQAELVSQLRGTHGGNIAKALTLAEAIVARLWAASASSDLSKRTLRQSDLNDLVGKVSERFVDWQRWEAMESFTSWASWKADHLHIGFVENEKGACSVLGVNFRPMVEEAIIEDVWHGASSDPVVSIEARELLREGRRCEAFEQDAVLRIRLLDAVRQTALQLYVVVATDEKPAKTIKRVVKLRAGTKGRRVMDIAAEESVFQHQPGLQKLRSDRPAVVALLSCIAFEFQRWRLDNHPDAERAMRWIAPRMKLLVDEEGGHHPSDSVLWEQLVRQ